MTVQLPMYDIIRPKFWENYPLSALNDDEWELLCDGCGVCCLIKYLDDEGVALTEYTDVACQLLDCATGQCSNYINRKRYVPDCIRLDYAMLSGMMWLPSHCAYKRLYLGQGLPKWHKLIAGEDAHRHAIAKLGVAGRCVSERGLSDRQIEERVITWVEI